MYNKADILLGSNHSLHSNLIDLIRCKQAKNKTKLSNRTMIVKSDPVMIILVVEKVFYSINVCFTFKKSCSAAFEDKFVTLGQGVGVLLSLNQSGGAILSNSPSVTNAKSFIIAACC